MTGQRQRWLCMACGLLALISMLGWWPWAPWIGVLQACWWLLGWWMMVLAWQVVLSQRANQAAWRMRMRVPDALPPVSGWRALWVWLWACWAAPQVFAWRQPWQEWRWPDQLPTEAEQPSHGVRAPRPVLLVHGFMANRGFWNPWLAHLTRRGEHVVAVSVRQATSALDVQAAELSAHVDRVIKATGQAPVIVAHSMGGLLVRAWLRLEAKQGLLWADRVHRVACLGSPLAGTGLAKWAHLSLARQMSLPADGGTWLPQLNADLHALGIPPALFACWASDADNMVFPAHTALLSEPAECHVLTGLPHVPLAFHPQVMRQVLALRHGAS